MMPQHSPTVSATAEQAEQGRHLRRRYLHHDRRQHCVEAATVLGRHHQAGRRVDVEHLVETQCMLLLFSRSFVAKCCGND